MDTSAMSRKETVSAMDTFSCLISILPSILDRTAGLCLTTKSFIILLHEKGGVIYAQM
jgi:hypothetical protein